MLKHPAIGTKAAYAASLGVSKKYSFNSENTGGLVIIAYHQRAWRGELWYHISHAKLSTIKERT
jgi:hypothetical protein